MPTLTIIISLIILAVYIFLLVANKSNPKTNGMLMVVREYLYEWCYYGHDETRNHSQAG